MGISDCRNYSNTFMRLALPIVLILIVIGLGMFASDDSDAEIQNGICNESVSWEFNTETKTLTFTGTGPLNNTQFAPTFETEHIIVGEGITSLENHAFQSFYNVIDVKLPDTLLTIGEWVFSDCPKIKTITIPANTQKIGNSAFVNSKDGPITSGSILETVMISPDSKLTEIGSRAFCDCKLLTTIELPESIKIIGDGAFSNCNLKNIKIPSSIEYIGTGCFGNNPEIKLTFCDNNVNYPMIDGVIYNNDFTSIMMSIGVTSSTISIPSTVQTIQDYAFQNDMNLEHIIFDTNNSLTSIGDFTFNDCKKLIDIKIINNKVQHIGNHSFEGCLMLNDTLINPELKTLGEYAYKNCRTITSIEIPIGITELNNNVFERCQSLSIVKFDPKTSLYKIGNTSFGSCTMLKDISLPSSVQIIGDNAFENTGLEYIHTSTDSNLTSIGKYAFQHSKLQSFTSQAKLESIGYYAFQSCKSLTEIHLEKSEKLTKLPMYMLYICNNLNTIELPKNLKEINSSCFYGTNIESITIPESVTKISSWAFHSTELKEITIKNSLIDIDFDAFAGIYGPCYVICEPGFKIYSNDENLHFHYSYEVHNVRFLDANGNVLNSQSVHFTDPIIPPTDTPLKDSDQTYDYVFNGWYDGYQQFTPDTHAYKDTDFTPGFDKSYIDYLITWKNHDGSVFKQQTNHYGDTIYKPYSNLYRDSDAQYHYSFSKWNGFTDGMTVTGNMEFTPEFTTTLRSYDVTFYDSDGYTIETTTLDYGSKIVLTSQEPYKYPDVQYNYQFAGWEGYTDGMTVTGPHTFYPLYKHTIRNYTVAFYNEGALFHSYSMDYGTEVTLPTEIPLKDSILEYDYTFSQWYGYYDGITVNGDMSFSAEYQASLRCYTIKFVSEGVTVSELSQEYGSYITVPENPVKEGDQVYSYLFSHWQGLNHTTVIGDETFTAAFKPVYREYTVKFISEGTVFSSKAYHYNDIIPAPTESPVKPSTAEFDYTFTGWNNFREGLSITSDCSFTANFQSSIRSYDVTFMNCGQVFWTGHLEYGTAIEMPAGTPVKGSDERFIYTFSGWDGFIPGMTVSGPHVFDSMFDRTDVLYRISFINNGTVFATKDLTYGTIITLPDENPVRESSAQYDFEFSYWNGFVEGMTVKDNSTFNSVYIENIRSYTIKFVSEGRVIQEGVLEYGATIPTPSDPTKPSDVRFDYTFSHWKGFGHSTVLGEETFTAAFDETPREYIVDFRSNDKLHCSATYHYGDVISLPTVPTMPSTVQFDYEFVRWAGYSDGMNVTGNTSFDAVFKEVIRTYQVSFVSDGRTIWSGELEYAATIPVPSEPARGSDPACMYMFSHWNGFEEGMTVSGAKVFDAVFDEIPRSYNIAFVDDGVTVKSEILEYGTAITAPTETPAKESDLRYDYVFSHWNGFRENMTVEGNAVFNAVFSSHPRSYTVKFISDNRTIQETVSKYGTEIQFPVDPVKESDDIYDYTFSYWKGAGHTTVTGNETFTAVYDKTYREYTIKFVSDGVTISTTSGHFGDRISAPADPVLKDTAEFEYRFAGWIGFTDDMRIDGEHTFNADFIQKTRIYSISFVSDGREVYSEDLPYNAEITAPSAPSKASDAEFNYSFRNWNGFTGGMKVTEDRTFEAVFDKEIRSYTVRFVSEGELISKKTVDYGTVIAAPENDPVKPDDDVYRYVFTSWKGYYAGIRVTEDCTFDAVFSNIYREYIISFISEGQIIEQRTQRYGSDITVPAEPKKSSSMQFDYTFAGWNGYSENMTVSGNCSFTAEFEEQLRNYHVVFKYEQNILADSMLPYGTVITLPEDPVIKGEDGVEYTFLGWNGYHDGMTVNGNVTFEALTQKIDITYTVQFRTDDALVDSRTYHYGEEILVPNAPEKTSTEQYDYIFVGWSGLKNGMTVTEDATFTAEFIEQLRTYTVTFISEGSKYIEYECPFGNTIELPKNPMKPSSDVYGYTFAGWYGYYDGMTVSGNCSFTASFEMVLESIPQTEPGNNIIIQMAPGCEIDIDVEMLIQITESMKQLESEFEIEIENGTISFDKDALDSIEWDGVNVTIECDVSDLSKEDLKAAGGRPVYDIGITGENGNISQFKNGDKQGSINVTVEYDLEDGEDEDDLCVWHLDDGKLKEKRGCTYSEKDGQGYVTFNTTHLSNYVVGHEAGNGSADGSGVPPGNNSYADLSDVTNMMYISIGVAAVGIICLLASIVIRRR